MLKKKKTVLKVAMLCSAVLFGTQAFASSEPLRVCAATDELPYSNKATEGFENSIAEVLAKTMDRPLEFVWSDKAAIFLVTEMLNKNKCDVVMGVDSDDNRVATSTPYYKSGYAFIYPEKSTFNVKDWTSSSLQDMKHFAIVPGSPSEIMLRDIGKYEGNFNYVMSIVGFKSRRNEYVRYQPDVMISHVATGKADVANLWAPEVARYVASSHVSLKMVMVSDVAVTSDGEGIRQNFEQSMAVRSDDTELLKEINTALAQSASEITSILKSEGIPLL